MLVVSLPDTVRQTESQVGISFVDPAADQKDLDALGRQLNVFFRDEVQPFYETELGATLIDPDGSADPDSKLWIDFRRDTLQRRNRTYCVARRLDESGKPSAADDAIRGIAVMDLAQSGFADLVEIDVARDDRGKGLGSLMLRGVVGLVKPANTIRLNVAETNERAKVWYRRLGFRPDGLLMHHGVYDVQHETYQAKASRVLLRLGINACFDAAYSIAALQSVQK